MTELKTTKEPLFRRNTEVSARKTAKYELLSAAALLLGVYFSQVFHLLEEPLFSRVYYGNLNSTFFAISAALYLVAFMLLFHRSLQRKLQITPFRSVRKPLSLRRKAIVYGMTVLPVVLTAAALNFRFKIIFELGERITGMTLLGNGVSYLYATARVFAAIYLIFLVERGMDSLFAKKPKLPYGGIATMLTFGLCDMLFINSDFAWLYVALYFYYGLIYLVTEKTFGITYAVAMILYIF